MLLSHPSFPATAEYTVTVETTSLLGNLAYVNTRRTSYRKQPLQQTAQGWLYALTTLNFEQTQTNGLAQLDADTAQLRQELLIETDAQGGLLRVGNKAELRSKWQDLQPELLRKYQGSDEITPAMIEGIGFVLNGDGYLEDVLRRGYEYSTLFPALYDQHFGSQPQPSRPRTFARFFGDLDLPVRTTARQKEPVPADVHVGLVLEGRVNQEEYSSEELGHALRTMTDVYNLDTTLRMEHVESYEFDNQHELRNAAQFTIYGVEGVFMTKNLCTLAAQAVG
jgi:hypothetical protein